MPDNTVPELTAEQEREAESWWQNLDEQGRILAAMRVVAGEYPSDEASEMLYAATKPWKWRDDAWLARRWCKICTQPIYRCIGHRRKPR